MTDSNPGRTAPPHSARAHAGDALSDFSTDRRVLLLCLLAVPIGAIGAVVAKALLWLIAVINSRFSRIPKRIPQKFRE